MRKKYGHAAFVAVSVSIAVALSACGDDSSSDFLSPESSADAALSSTETPGSSDTQDLSSSSAEADESSSSAKAPGESSSSVKVSDAVEISCDGYSKPVWNYMNEEIDYGCIQDPRDNQVYRTVKMGERVWMAENLNYETGNSYCYNDADSNCTKYGRLYTWAAAMDSVGKWSTNGKGCGYDLTCSPTYPVRGVCPAGWHLPDTTEWKALFTAVGGRLTAGMVLKSTSGWYNSGNGSDAFGFSALPASLRGNGGDFLYEGDYACFWSSTENGGDNACSMYLRYYDDYASLEDENKNKGYSVRCLKDYEAGDVPSSSSSAGDEDQCEAMVKTDITTWHFTKNDDFGDPVEYQYSINGDGQIELTTSGVNITGGTNTKVLYQKSTEVYMEMAYSAAKATCQD